MFLIVLSRKDARAKTQLDRHTRILNQCLIKREVSPAGMEILNEMRESKLRAKAEFREREVPSFAREADYFWGVLESFGRAVRVDCIRYLEDKISQWKTKRGVVFFDDLLSITAKAVNSESVDGQSLRDTLRNSIDAALIDEFQDTDPVQFKIFSRLFGQKRDHWLFLIGDPKQSIYRFRGADLEAYFEFAKKHKGPKVFFGHKFSYGYSLGRVHQCIFSEVHQTFPTRSAIFPSVQPQQERACR